MFYLGLKNIFQATPTKWILVVLLGVLLKISDEHPVLFVWNPAPGMNADQNWNRIITSLALIFTQREHDSWSMALSIDEHEFEDDLCFSVIWGAFFNYNDVLIPVSFVIFS